MEKPLTILYTANLRGDLARLPRLHTFLRGLKRRDEVAATRILLLDAGKACAPEVWHCAATGGRSTLIVLDAMGYDAANVSGFLTAAGRARLDANYLGMALVDAAHPWERGGVMVVGEEGNKPSPPAPLPQGEGCLRVVLPASPVPGVGEGLRPSPTEHDVYLPLLDATQVGLIRVAWADGLPVIRARDVLDMPPHTPPDPTISAAVEFVLAEARRYGESG